MESDHNGNEFRLTGLGISTGLGMGKAYVIRDVFATAADVRTIEPSRIEPELSRLRDAFQETRAELDESARRIEEQLNADLAGIFRAHGTILENLLASGEFEQEVRGSLVNAETAVKRVFRRWHEKFLTLKDATLRHRADDIADLARKTLRHLQGKDGFRLKNLPAGSILVLRRLLPSDVVSLSRNNVTAIIVEALGQGSHAALLVREKSIPTIADIPGVLDQIQDGDELLVDGAHGTVVVSANEETRTEFQDRCQKQNVMLARWRGDCHRPARTLDDELVEVEANIGAYDEVQSANDNGADGIGLFRIEQLYLARELPPTTDELLGELRTVTAGLREMRVTMRLLDVGGDKPLPYLRFPEATNPALGKRGVRLLLENPQLARVQFAALLRLSQEQEIRLLVPMVTLVEDIRAMRDLYEEMLAELGMANGPALGAMIETPAAALNVPAIAQHVDFLSVGTNDLTQYTLAAGRDDSGVNRYYIENHASILRLLGIVVADAGQTPLTLCGELAGKEDVIPQLLTIGFRSLSIAPSLIPATKELIRGLRIQATETR